MTSTSEEQNQQYGQQSERDQSSVAPKATITHNLDTGEDEPLEDLDDESVMDFGSGSGGDSGGDGGAS